MSHRLSTCYPGLLLAAACIMGATSAVANAFDDERELIAEVSADGMLFGFARVCNAPKADLDRFVLVSQRRAKETAQAKVPRYGPASYETDFTRGMAKAVGLAGAQPPGSDSYERNCAEVRTKLVQRGAE